MGKFQCNDKNKARTMVSNRIDPVLTKVYNCIKKLNEDLNIMMKGDSSGPYWEGSSAMMFYEDAVKNMKNDILNYNKSRKICAEDVERLDKLLKKDESVKSGGSSKSAVIT